LKAEVLWPVLNPKWLSTTKGHVHQHHPKDLFSWALPGKSLIIFLIHHPHNLIKLNLKTLSLSHARILIQPSAQFQIASDPQHDRIDTTRAQRHIKNHNSGHKAQIIHNVNKTVWEAVRPLLYKIRRYAILVAP
jgi:hypothetical protein